MALGATIYDVRNMAGEGGQYRVFESRKDTVAGLKNTQLVNPVNAANLWTNSINFADREGGRGSKNRKIM